jgi:hypothetical protein
MRIIPLLIPKSQFGAAILGIAITALSGVALSAFSTEFLATYGYVLFCGLPFFCGFTSVFIYGYHEERSWSKSFGVALLSLLIVSAVILVFAFEGIICLLMAAPLAVGIALPGAALGHFLASKLRNKRLKDLPLVITFLMMPMLMGFEAKLKLEPPVRKVVTLVDIKATPQEVWKYVVAFPPIPEPDEFIFKIGIAYPKDAQIRGKGVGAVRHCNFTTGPFVEPIRVWDEPRLLQFDVTHNPSPMKEISFYQNLQPPHLHNFMVSKKGQFKLTQINATTTRLEGTTWYYHRLWPTAYWHIISDSIIHKIHYRVLNHVKKCAEPADQNRTVNTPFTNDIVR